MYIHTYLCIYIYVYIYMYIYTYSWKNLYRVAKTHRMPYLYRSLFAKEPYNYWNFRKETCDLGPPMQIHLPVHTNTRICKYTYISHSILERDDEILKTAGHTNTWIYVYIYTRSTRKHTNIHTGWRRPIHALSCRSFLAKEQLIIGLFCGKWPIKIRHPISLHHPVYIYMPLYPEKRPRHSENILTHNTWIHIYIYMYMCINTYDSGSMHICDHIWIHMFTYCNGNMSICNDIL